MAITADNWKVDADGDWSNPANWSNGKLPTSNNTVTISTADVHTITHNSGNDIIDKLTVGQDFFQLNGGSLQILTTASFADGFTQGGGVLTTGAVSVTGPLLLSGGSSEGSTAFTVNGATTIGNYTLGGSSVLNVASTADQTGGITLGDASGVNASISNVSGATYEIAGDFGIAQGAASASFVNAGTLTKGSGSGTSLVSVSVTSTGTVSAASGTLQFNGPTNSIRGTVSGAGQIAFGGASVTTFGVTAPSVATLGIYGAATLNLSANLTFAHTFSDISNGTTTLNLGAHTVALTGPSGTIEGSFGSAVVTGSGAFNNRGVLTLSGIVLGGTLTFTNSKTVNQAGNVQIGDGSGNAPVLNNAAAGVYDFTTDSSIGQDGGASTFTNAGTLEKTAASGVSIIGLAVANTGRIIAQQGTLQFNTSLTNTGTISGAGTVQIGGGGVATLNSGTVLSVANLDLSNSATLNLATSLSYAGVFNDSSNGTTDLNLASGVKLTLSGTSNTVQGAFGSATINGSGVLANAGTLALGNAVLGGTVTLSNSGTLNQVGSIQVGDGSGNAPALTNTSTGVYDFTTDTGISQNAGASTFTNAGALEKTGGSGVSALGLAVVNSGTISVQQGTLQFNASLVNTGTISGAGTLQIAGNGVATLNSGTVLSVASIGLFNSATLNVSTSLTYAGVFEDDNGATDLNLSSGVTLTLSGASNAVEAPFGVATVGGSGTLANTGTLNFGGAVVDGRASINNTGTINQVGNITIGGAGNQVASIVNAASSTYNLVGALSIGDGVAAASHFDNSGTFSVAAGTGAANISTTFNNLKGGVINITTGVLQNNGILVDAGAISGTRLLLANSSQTTINSLGSQLTVQELDLENNSVLNVGAAVTYTGQFLDYGAGGTTTINLGTHTLVLSGGATFNSDFGSNNITGSGVLRLTHASLIGGGTEISGTASLQIAAVTTVTATLQIGDSSANAASLLIQSNGTYDLTNDSGVSQGSQVASTLTNDGLFEKTAGTGTSLVSAAFVNDGTITVTSGRLEFLAGAFTNNGTINGVVTTDGSGDTFIAAAGGGGSARRAVTPAAHNATATRDRRPGSSVSAHQLVQAAAAFGVDVGGSALAFGPQSARTEPLLTANAPLRHA